MKTSSIILFLSFAVIAAFGLSCANSAFRNLEYEDVSIHDWIQASVKKKNGQRVIWFQVFDHLDDASIKESYLTSTDTFGKYPAKIYENKWVWILVNDRIEIRLIADDDEDDYQNTDRLKEFLRAFDLAGMEKITGPKVAAGDLEAYIPRLNSK